MSRRGGSVSLKTSNSHLKVNESEVVVNLCFTSFFGTKGLLSDIVIR